MKFQVWSMLAVVVLMLSLAIAKPVPTKPSPDARIEAQQLLQRQIEKEFGQKEWFKELNASINKFVGEEEKPLASHSDSTSKSPVAKPASASDPVTPKSKKPEAAATPTKKTMSEPNKEKEKKTDKPATPKADKTVPPKAAKPTATLPSKSGVKSAAA